MSLQCVYRWFAISVIISFILNFVESIDENIVSVRIRDSVINGKIETTVDGKQLNVFRGIPYAEPPTGDLRFKKPLPVKQWPNVINAFESIIYCNQNTGSKTMGLIGFTANMSFSEDCLYLNIWSPIDDKNSDVLKPVMFWIHGGALSVGSANEADYDGQVLAAKGDVVLVSINYRLSTLGFLYAGTDEAPGNVGLWDQALALEWVNDNIRYFSGNPEQITVFGESAGSWSTGLHILSPVSRNLFKNAIMNSGAFFDSFMDETQEMSINRWLKGAKLIGCSDEQNENIFTEKIINCLREKDPEELTLIPELPELFSGSVKTFSPVVVDGEFLPQKPSHMLREGNFKQNLNLLFSTTEDEGSFILVFWIDFDKYHPISPKNSTFNEAYDELKTIFSTNGINGEEVAKLYFTGLSDSNDFDVLRRTIGIAVGDYYLLCPTIDFAKQVFRQSKYNSNVYQYYFNSKMKGLPDIKWSGVSHGMDISPMFGLPLLLAESYSNREREISQQMIEFLTHFARTGTPSPQNGASWPNYYIIDDNIIAPYYEITTEPKPNTNFNIGLKTTECDYLWRKYLI